MYCHVCYESGSRKRYRLSDLAERPSTKDSGSTCKQNIFWNTRLFFDRTILIVITILSIHMKLPSHWISTPLIFQTVSHDCFVDSINHWRAKKISWYISLYDYLVSSTKTPQWIESFTTAAKIGRVRTMLCKWRFILVLILVLCNIECRAWTIQRNWKHSNDWTKMGQRRYGMLW